MFCWEAAQYYLRRLVGLHSSLLEQVAVKTVEISPPEVRPNRPTIMLPNQMQRIKAYCTDTNLALETERLSAATRSHKGTYAYLLNNAIIINGNLFSDGYHDYLLPSRQRQLWFDVNHEKSEAALCSSLYGNTYWGHWVLDDCLKYFLAEKFGKSVAPERPAYTHQADYERLLGMKVRRVNAVQFESLWVFDDNGQNASKGERYQLLRERLLKSIGMENPVSHPGVYLLRGMSGARRYLVNETELAEHLLARGFTVLDPMESTAEEILKASAGAKIVAGVEGSALAHAMTLMAPESTLMVINPPNRFNNVYKDMTDCMKTNYAVHVGVLKGDDFYADLNEIDQTLELIRDVV